VMRLNISDNLKPSKQIIMTGSLVFWVDFT
jgi:hypothetical protein